MDDTLPFSLTSRTVREGVSRPAAPRDEDPAAGRPRLLTVDHQPHVRDAHALQLRRIATPLSAASAVEALALLRTTPDVAVILANLRLPRTDGVAFLAQARHVAPESVRVLLAAPHDQAEAVRALQDGTLFRFVTSPGPASALVATVQAAIEQYRLVTAERVLLEQTLLGVVKTLTDVLSLASPNAFGRASRVKRIVADLAGRLALRERWQPQVAAVLSQVACVALPSDTVYKLNHGRGLTADEQVMVRRLPVLTEQLLAHIPRLDEVRRIIADAARPPLPRHPADTLDAEDRLRWSAQVLRAARDYDHLVMGRALDPWTAVAALRARPDVLDLRVIDALAALYAAEPQRPAKAAAPDDPVPVRAVPVDDLQVGMVLGRDLRNARGHLIAGRGHEVTPSFVERLLNWPRRLRPEELWVVDRTQRVDAPDGAPAGAPDNPPAAVPPASASPASAGADPRAPDDSGDDWRP